LISPMHTQLLRGLSSLPAVSFFDIIHPIIQTNYFCRDRHTLCNKRNMHHCWFGLTSR
jgi:hypothetical protein